MIIKENIRTIRSILRRTILHTLRLLGHEFESVSLSAAFERCKKRNVVIQTVIDVGASDGRWSIECSRYYPKASYFLIEAQKPHERDLIRLKRNRTNFDYIMAAAGDKEGEIYFDASELLGGIAGYKPFNKNCITVPLTTIDVQVAAHHLQPPFLIKLDTHGFELPILEGAMETLKRTELIVIEVYNFNFSEDNIRFPQMCQHIEELGFRCIDICDPLFRPVDKALWQFDLFFMPTHNSVFKTNQFRKQN